MMERQMGRGETRTGGALEMKEEWMGERGDEDGMMAMENGVIGGLKKLVKGKT